MHRPASMRGWTLIEVLVALAVVALAIATGLTATGALTRNAQRQSDAVLAQLADAITVMRAGRVVEQSEAVALFDSPREAYTRQLLDAARRLELGAGRAQ